MQGSRVSPVVTPLRFAHVPFAEPLPNPVLLQSKDGSFLATSNTTNPTAFTNANTAGSLLVAMVWWDGSGAYTFSSVTDTAGNTWQKIGAVSSCTSTNFTKLYCQMAYCYPAKAGANTVTGNFTGTPAFTYIAIGEFSGVGFLDSFSLGSGTTSPMQTAVVAPQQQREVVISFVVCDASVGPTAGAGFTQVVSGTAGGGGWGWEYQIQNAATTLAPTFTDTLTDYCACSATFAALPVTFYQGAANGIATETALLTATGKLAGSTTGQATETGHLISTGKLLGSSSGHATETGLLTAGGKLVGSSAGHATDTGLLTASGKLLGTSAGHSSETALLKANGKLAGTSAGHASETGLAIGVGKLVGSSSGHATETALLKASGKLVGSSAGHATETALLKANGTLVGSSSGHATETALLKANGKLVGSSSGHASSTALLTALGGGTVGVLVGNAAGHASEFGFIVNRAMVGHATGHATVRALVVGVTAIKPPSNFVAATRYGKPFKRSRRAML